MVANKNFLPNDDQAEFEVGLRAPEGTSLEATEIIANRIATQNPEAARCQLYARLGRRRSGAERRTRHGLRAAYSRSTSAKQDQFELMNVVREQILPAVGVPNLRTGVRPVATIGGGGNQNAEIQFTISGPDLKKLEQLRQRHHRRGEEAAGRRRSRHVAERRQAGAVGGPRPPEGGRSRRAGFGRGGRVCGCWSAAIRSPPTTRVASSTRSTSARSKAIARQRRRSDS